MDTLDTLKILKRIVDDSALVKAIIQKEVSSGRMLVDETTQGAIKDLLLISGNDIATAEVLWNEFGRIGLGNKRFAIQRKTIAK